GVLKYTCRQSILRIFSSLAPRNLCQLVFLVSVGIVPRLQDSYLLIGLRLHAMSWRLAEGLNLEQGQRYQAFCAKIPSSHLCVQHLVGVERRQRTRGRRLDEKRFAPRFEVIVRLAAGRGRRVEPLDTELDESRKLRSM